MYLSVESRDKTTKLGIMDLILSCLCTEVLIWLESSRQLKAISSSSGVYWTPIESHLDGTGSWCIGGP